MRVHFRNHQDPGIGLAIHSQSRQFTKNDQPRIRQIGTKLALLLASILIPLVGATAQITNVTDDTSAPIRGVGHDYIHLLNETVNPANGSASVNIEIPLPRSRGITVPFGVAYNSNGTNHLLPTV
jgi:hypothetical protein